MTKRYHAVPETGDIKTCVAKIKCEYGEGAVHGDTPAEARAGYEERMKGAVLPPRDINKLINDALKEKADHEAEALKKSIDYEERVDKVFNELLKDVDKSDADKVEDAHSSARDIVNQEIHIENNPEGSYSFPYDNFEAAVSKIEAANRRLEKAGIEDRFTYEVTERFAKKTDKDPETGDTFEYAEMYYDVQLNAPKLSYDGYEFQAVLNREGEGFITRSSPDTELNGYRPEAMVCDHCGHNRHRAKTYLVKGPDGEMKQIGSTCVESYLGVKPEGLWALEFDNLDDMQKPQNGARSAPMMFEVDDTLAMSLAASEGGMVYGNSYSQIPTSRQVSDIRMGGKGVDRAWRAQMQQDAQEYKASGAVAELKKKVNEMDGDSDYAQNLKAAISGEYVSPRSHNILVSAVSMLGREERAKRYAQEKADRDAAKPKFTKGHYGQPEDKLKNVEFELVGVKAFNTYDFNGYEVTKYTTTMKDSEGRQLTYFASEDITDLRDDKGMVTFTSGRVKEHGSFNDTDQTTLSHMRAKKPKAPKVS